MRASPQPRQIGRYEILGALAHGGMAELFVARLTGAGGFSKRVVLKRVLPTLARDREFVDMFIAEARIAATLDHQNIVQVHDIGHDAEGHFFVMELLHGADVGNLLRTMQDRGGVPRPIALEIARGACAGLHYAHERVGPMGATLGLVHRDISPQNVFVTIDGAVKLLDWGIAKAVERISNHLTRSGTLRGKIPYMSPEQCRGEPLDRRSDVFSLGIVLWEMTVGERLFGAAGESDFQLLKQIVEHDAPAPSTRDASYPAELERIVMKALRRDPRDRYPTADALQLDLEAYLRATGTWVTTRELAAFMASVYPERAAELRRAETAATPEGKLVPFPNARAIDRATAELPIEDALHREPTRAPTAEPAPPRRARRWPFVVAPVAAIAAIAIGFAIGRSSSSSSSSSSPSPSSSPAPQASPGSGSGSASGSGSGSVTEDDQWFQSDDFLVAKQGYRGEKLTRLRVAKQLRPPAQPNGIATFLDATGSELQTDAYWRTRPARADDLVIGRLAFCRAEAHVRRAKAPATKQEARLGVWILAKITDTFELASDHVTVGDTACEISGVRVPI